MRATWSGYIHLGDLIAPVRLYPASRTVSPRFVQLHAVDHTPVKRITVCQKDGEEVPADEIIRAVEHDGKYIELASSELKRSGTGDNYLRVRQFSESQAIHPLYYDKPYYIVPGKGGELAYTLLRQAFVKAKKIAIVTYSLYDKEHLGIISVYDGMLFLQQLRFAGEIVPRSDIPTVSLPQPSPDQVDIAVKLMERYSTPFYIDDYRNHQLQDVRELIKRKAKGLPPKKQPRITPQTTSEEELVPTLRALLRQPASEQMTKRSS